MAKLTCLIFVVLFVAGICSAEPPRVFGRILNQNLLFQRQELPEDDGPYPPAGNVPELPLEPQPAAEYGPPQPPQIPAEIPSTSYGVPINPSQVYGAPAEPESERIVVHQVPARFSVRHIYKLPVHSERIVVPSHHHHAQRLVAHTHHSHHADRLVVPSHHDHHLHSERLIVPSHHDHHFEKLSHSGRLVHSDIPATVIKIRVHEE